MYLLQHLSSITIAFYCNTLSVLVTHLRCYNRIMQHIFATFIGLECYKIDLFATLWCNILMVVAMFLVFLATFICNILISIVIFIVFNCNINVQHFLVSRLQCLVWNFNIPCTKAYKPIHQKWHFIPMANPKNTCTKPEMAFQSSEIENATNTCQ